MMKPNIEAQVAAYWAKTQSSANWWSNRAASRNYNFRVCGKPISGPAAGIHELIKSKVKTPLSRGISVGCGIGVKEIALVKAGAVESVIGYDLSPDRISIAKKKAAEAGVADKAIFYCENPFEKHRAPAFDLIYWDNALHHMPDVRAAIEWSHSVLADGGAFAMDEYVGPNRFLVSDDEWEFINMVRGSLPERILLKPNGSGQSYPRTLTKEWLARTIEKDPSEAVDAGATLGAIRDVFPSAIIRPTGGMLFFIALNGLYGGFKTDEDVSLLKILLMLDYEATRSGKAQTLYGAALALKGKSLVQPSEMNDPANPHLAAARANEARALQRIQEMKQSLSWRITKPLRFFSGRV